MIMENLIVNDILRITARGYDWLYERAIETGHWGDVRSTALASIALELREPINSRWLTESRNWLLFEQTEDKETGLKHWNEEVWDTAMAVFALNRLQFNQNEDRYADSVQWIISLYDRTRRNNWHDEPWETCWALITLVFDNSAERFIDIIISAMDWLLSLRGNHGMIIAPHYTAYYLVIYEKLKEVAAKAEVKLDSKFEVAADEAAYCLINELDDQLLWNGETWANGQILWALCLAGRFPLSNTSICKTVVDWFSKQQEPNYGCWEDEEDTASALIGLCQLLIGIERIGSEDDLRVRLRAKFETPELRVRPKLFEKHSNGYYSINLSPELISWGAILFTAASVAWLLIDFGGYIISFFN